MHDARLGEHGPELHRHHQCRRERQLHHCHVNQTSGTVPITVTFAGDAYYRPASASGTETTAAPPSGGGGFVIGDVSAGVQPTARHGTGELLGLADLEDQPVQRRQQCAGVHEGIHRQRPRASASAARHWTSDPGNSSNPPATIPDNMVVVVASSIPKSGSTESGNIEHLVVVSVAPGYGPAPGHDGCGNIIATLC